MLERTEPVGETPMLHHLAIHDTENVDPHHRNRLACGRDGPERTLVGATDADKGHHLVPISEKVLHGNFHVREGIEVHTEKLARPLGKARRHRHLEIKLASSTDCDASLIMRLIASETGAV